MAYRIMDLKFEGNKRINNKADLSNVADGQYELLLESFVTYIYYNFKKKIIYIGETKQFITRHNQHIGEQKFSNGEFTECVVIYNANDFSESHVKDLEYLLINYMFAEKDVTKFTILNGNKGQIQPKDFFDLADFMKLWEQDLFERKLVVTNNLDKIKNKILFKYSPFKKLSETQAVHEKEILVNPEQLYMVEGSAGTGKSVLLMSLVYRLATEHPDKKIAVVTTGNLTDKFNKVLKQLKLGNQLSFERAGKVIQDARNSKKKYDVILVDEAHRLQRYYPKGHPEAKKHFEKDKSLNELEMLQEVSEGLVLFYDAFQSIRPQDIRRDDYLKQTKYFKVLPLKQQFRIKTDRGFSGEDFVKGLLFTLDISGETDFNSEVFSSSEKESYFGVVNSITELFEYVEEMDCTYKNTTNRVLGGYTKEWLSNPNASKNKGVKYENLPYDWKEDDKQWRWNRQHEKWVEVETSKKEIGSIHAIQGADLDYVGIIVGNDITVGEDGKLKAVKANYKDKGGTPLLDGFEENEFTVYLLSIYYILLTRGISGCRIYFEDKKVEKYFLNKISQGTKQSVIVEGV